jgi:hypothetical protein
MREDELNYTVSGKYLLDAILKSYLSDTEMLLQPMIK